MDEPTSGLDSRSALSVVEHVVNLAQSGRAIALTIHQPSAQMLRKFDRLLLLSSGKCIYFGPMSSTLDYFASVLGRPCETFTNPSDHYMNLINADFEDHLDLVWMENKYAQSQIGIAEKTKLTELKQENQHQEVDLTLGNNMHLRFGTPRYYQIYILFKRQVICYYL